MTTTVTVKAHCASSITEVMVSVFKDAEDSVGDITVLQDGEERDFLVYDGRSIVVREVPKAQEA